MTALRLAITGRVQGVGYRYAMIEAAAARGVTGWVRNRSDGSVEAFVQGDTAAVEALVAWCRRGPSAARVEAVDAQPAATDSSIVEFYHRSTY